jgi:hypothetical protein
VLKTPEKMPKYLTDIDLYIPPSEGEEAKMWALSTNFLEVLYLDYLPKVETKGVSKVVLRPCRKAPEKRLEVVLRNPIVLQISKIFDFDAYWNAGKAERKQIALDFLQDGLLEVAESEGWSKEPFQQAYKKVLDQKLVNYRPWGKLKTSPTRKYKSQVWCNYDSDCAEIFLVLFQNGEIVCKKLVTTVLPGDVWIRGAIGELQWVSAGKVKLTSRDELQSWEIAVEEG